MADKIIYAKTSSTMKPAIPSTQGLPSAVRAVVDPLKVNLEIIEGRRGTPIAMLPANPTAAQLASKINEILTLLQG